jgi:endoglucanase
MHNKIAKAVTASLMATTLLSTTVGTVLPMTVSAAGQILGETTFDYKALPWHTCETSPAKQTFKIEDGAFHVTILNNQGGDKDRWDLQVRHRNLNFYKGCTYKIKWRAKASRNGVKVYTKIGDISGDHEYWCCNENGPHNNPAGQWGTPVELTTSYQDFESTWTCGQDLEAAEWCFHYAQGGSVTNSGENTKNGDEIWFDSMSIENTTDDRGVSDPKNRFGAMNRDYSADNNPEMLDSSGKLINYISVNQLGYYTNLEKTATLGDNKGDILHGASSVDIGTSPLKFELINESTGAAVYDGMTEPTGQDADSGDYTHKIDFTEFDTPGRYYLKVGDWRSFAFDISDSIYTDAKGEDTSSNLLTNAVNYFYQNRSGCDIDGAYITSGTDPLLAHEGGHKTDRAAVQTQWVDSYANDDDPLGQYKSSEIEATGGWYDAGDHGKYVVNGGISVWTLQNMYERAIQTDKGKTKFANNSGTVVVPETNNKNPDILDECIYELDFMEKMIVKENEPTWGKYAGLVYHKLHDHKWTGLATRPYNYESQWKTHRIVKPPTFAATLNFVACAAQAARLLKDTDPSKASAYLAEAKTSFEAFKKNFYEYTPAEATNNKSLYAPLDQSRGGGAYGDTEVKDDAYWAACELLATTGEKEYYDYIKNLNYDGKFKITPRVSGGENDASYTAFNWGNTGAAGSFTLLLNEDKLSKILSSSDIESINSSLVETADAYIATENKQGYGIPYLYDGKGYSDAVNLTPDIIIKGYEWGSNSMVINNAMAMAYAYDQTKDIKYMNGVATAMDYLFGRNPLSASFITGYGSYHTSRPHHRYWSNELDKTLPMAPAGILSGGPNAGLQDPYVRALGFEPGNPNNPSQRCYVDSIEAWSTNEVTINWNSPLAWIVSFMQDEASGATASGVTVTPSSITLDEGATKKIDVKVNGAAASGATFTSSDEGVAKVSSDGTVTAVKEGEATITVSVNGTTKTVSVTVNGSTTPSSDKPTSQNPSEEDPTEQNGTAGDISEYTGSDLLYGDVDLDGAAARTNDCVVLAKYIANKNKYPFVEKEGIPNSIAKAQTQADVTHDKKLATDDLLKLVEALIGKLTVNDLAK